MPRQQEISVDQIAVKDLYDFAREVYDNACPGSVNPLAKHAALAQSKNPSADPDQIGLVVIRQGQRIGGHASFVPGRVRHDGEIHPVIYASSIYLDAELRHNGAINKVLERLACGDLPPDIIGCSLSPDAQGMIEHIGGKKFGPRVDPTLEPQRLLHKLGKARYPAAKKCFYQYAVATGPRLPHGLIVEETDQIRPEALDGLENEMPTALHRTVEAINWGLRYPWVLSEDETTDRYPNAYFQMIRSHYRIFAVNLHDSDGSYRGYVMLSTSTWSDPRRTTVRVLDHRIAGDRHEAASIVEHLGLRYGQQYGADRIEFPSVVEGSLKRRHVIRRLVGSIQSSYAFVPMSAESPLHSFIDKIELNTCDGDFWHA